MAKRAAKSSGKRTRTVSSQARAAESITGLSLEQTVFERRLEVARIYLRFLSAVEPIELAAWQARRDAASQLGRMPKDGAKTGLRHELAVQLNSRRPLRNAIRSYRRQQWAILGPLESEILDNHGEIKRLQRGGVEGFPTIRGFDPGPQQHQKKEKRRPATVLRAPAHCQVLCSTCVEGAILGVGRILRELRSLVADFDEDASARGKILTESGQLRSLPRKILENLADPVDTLDALAGFAGVGHDSVRKITSALKQFGLITGDAHRNWARTSAGAQLLLEPA